MLLKRLYYVTTITRTKAEHMFLIIMRICSIVRTEYMFPLMIKREVFTWNQKK